MKNNEKILAAALLLSGLFCVSGCSFAKVNVTPQAQTSEVQTQASSEQLQDKEATVEDGVLTITEEGSYTADDSVKQIVVDADKDADVQIVLNGVNISCEGTAGIYVKQADKVIIKLADGSTNTITNTGAFVADGENDVDAAIYSKDDLVITGSGSLTVSSEQGHGIATSNELTIESGNITVNAAKDGLHAKEIVQVSGGSIKVDSKEGIEGTYVIIDDGDITINASDDGINASAKDEELGTPKVEINGGNLTITMGQGDTDAIDSNGDLYINGGNIDITAQSPFDYDGTAEHNGGTIIVNGEEITELSNQFGGAFGGKGNFGQGGPKNGGMMQGNPPEGFDPENMPEGFNPGERPERGNKKNGTKQQNNQ